MPDTSLSKKLGIKAGHAVLVLNAPEDFALSLPDDATLATRPSGAFDVVVLFARDRAALEKSAKRALAATHAKTLFWGAYPKGTSGVATDLTRDSGWDAIHDAGWMGIAAVSIDDTWSAARFRPGTAKELKDYAAWLAAFKARSSAPKKTAKKKPVAVVTAPEDLVKALKRNAKARAFFDGLAPSHRREWVKWIEEAKRAETRVTRVKRAVERLAEGKKATHGG